MMTYNEILSRVRELVGGSNYRECMTDNVMSKVASCATHDYTNKMRNVTEIVQVLMLDAGITPSVPEDFRFTVKIVSACGLYMLADGRVNDARVRQNVARVLELMDIQVPVLRGASRASHPRTAEETVNNLMREAAQMTREHTQRQENNVDSLRSMLVNALTMLNSLQAQSQPENRFPYTFGVEIECFMRDRQKFIRSAEKIGIMVRDESYNHNDHTDGVWKFVSDASVNGGPAGYCPIELVSPVLSGEMGAKKLMQICALLDAHNVKVNNSCGLHVHIGTQDFTSMQLYNLVHNFAKAEDVMKKCTWKSRTGSNADWARPIGGFLTEIVSRREWLPDTSKDEIAENFMRLFGTRYTCLNMVAYRAHKTVEFRQHQGTTSFDKIIHWVLMLERLAEYSKNNFLETTPAAFADLPWVDDDLVMYYTAREECNEEHA